MFSSVGLQHYAGTGLNGFGLSSQEDVKFLNKALQAGYEASPDLQVGGAALRVESLEESLKVLTYNNKHIVFWQDIAKSPAYSTVEEFNTQESYGNDFYGPFVREGELPLQNDSTYRRNYALVKYLGTVREITHPATLIHPAHGDLIVRENESGILWLLRQIEINLFRGNSRLAPVGATEGEQWDGLTNLIDPNSYIDLEGASLQESDIEEAANLISLNFGDPTHVYSGYTPLSDLVKTMYPRHRVALPAPENGRIGQKINAMMTQSGELELRNARFIERPPVAPSAARGPANYVPDAPASVVLSVAAGPGVGEFDKSQGADSARYAYIVTAANRFGESAPSPAALSAIVTGAQALDGFEIQLTITNLLGLARPPDWFNIYRTLALSSSVVAAPTDPAAYSLVKQVRAESQASGGITPLIAGSLSDINRVMPFTEEIYIGQMTPDVITFRQLAPLMKLDLAVVAPAYRWMILLYGVMILYARRKWIKLINVGRLS